MTQRVKRSLFLLLFLFSLLFAIAAICCKNTKEISYDGDKEKDTYVYDIADTLSKDTIKKVNDTLVDLEKNTGIKIYLILIDALNENTIDKYANNLFNVFKISK